MDSQRITNGGSFTDLRLTLERVGDRVVSLLSSFEDLQSSDLLRHESSVDWDLVTEGLHLLQHPEDHLGEAIEKLGDELGRAAFSSAMLRSIVVHLESRNVRLWLKPQSELANLPWEACSFPGAQGPVKGILSMHPGLAVIREVGYITPPSSKKVGQTRVLVAWADPSSEIYPHLAGLEKEVNGIVRGLSANECRRFEVEELRFATPAALAKTIKSFRPDILHFVGHGDLLPTGGVLVLESGEPRVEALLHGDEFAAMLGDVQLRVLVLSGCMTGEASTGVGPELALYGVPVVIGMQAPLQDGAAILFARAFYGSLAVGETIDDAVLEGRVAIKGTGNDWVAPVVMRAPFDGPRFVEEEDFDLAPEESGRRHNLTYDERPFIGRQVERLEIRDRICLRKQRLLTITGMGGMGKTRLAKQVAVELLDDFPDGVWMVECDTLDGREELVGAIASALGLAGSGSDAEAEIAKSVESKKLLLFLDCFERIVSHADVIDGLLRNAPDCQVLVTSRVVLGLNREFEYRLSPMNLKKKAGTQSDGVSLFAEAASHAVNEFELTAKNRSLVKELCEELEGVPLAIVLAAGRLRHLTLTELLEQIRQNPLDVLRRRGGPNDRQADLYSVVASSFLLLGPRECTLLDKLGLFVGGFYAEDAAEVCGCSKTEMLSGLSTLRDHSLVQTQLREDRTRYKLLDTVREFLDQLPRDDGELGERQVCARRHAERYARSADLVGSLMGEGRWFEGTSLLWAEIGNLRVACKYAIDENKYELVRRFANGLARVYFEVNLFDDFEQISSAGLEVSETLDDLAFESRLRGLTGALAAVRKDEAGWRRHWMRRLEICKNIGDLAGCTDVLCDMAGECVDLDKYTEANELLRQAHQIVAKSESPALIATCYANQARLERRLGNVSTVEELIRLATEQIRLSTEPELDVFVWQSIGIYSDELGFLDCANEASQKVLNLSLESHRYRGIAWSLLRLAEVHERAGEQDLALICLLSTVKLQSEVATRHGQRAKALLSQFVKKHGPPVDQQVAGYKRTAWASLVRKLPYVEVRISSI